MHGSLESTANGVADFDRVAIRTENRVQALGKALIHRERTQRHRSGRADSTIASAGNGANE